MQEFKNFNEKLIKFFDHDKLKTLIDYITVMPKEDSGYARGRKYPYITGEIFNCEINQILDKFFEAPVKAQPEEEKNFDEDDDEKDAEDKAASDSDDEKPEKTEEAKEAAAKDLEEVEKQEESKDANAEAEKDDNKEEAKTENP